MRGLRTKEDKKFLKYFEKVQECAKLKESVFFLDFGECNDTTFKDMIIDELFGWLIPFDKAEEFEILFNEENVSDDWDRYCCWVIPDIKDNELNIVLD
ncbi:MAG: hypothetical protein Q4E37_01415 [Tissierellia bacterium]|nr:hypothetical protein [Tissierellia bacterium]